MADTAFKSLGTHDNGRAFLAKWYRMSSGLIMVTIQVTIDGKKTWGTHAANLNTLSAENYVANEVNDFYKDGEALMGDPDEWDGL